MEVDERENGAAELERQHFLKTVASFKFYAVHMLNKIEKSEKYFSSLSGKQRSLVCDFPEHCKWVRKCVHHNLKVITKMLSHSAPGIFNGDHLNDLGVFEGMKNGPGDKSSTKSSITKAGPFAFTSNDVDKVRSTLKQFARDWSAVGKAERDICYQPVIDNVLELFNPETHDPSKVKVLVPGAGLGRLAWELAHRGYACQGNEWSLHMLIPAYFVLNACQKVNEHSLYPWLSQFCNNMKVSDQLTPVKFPDVCPADVSPSSQFSMAAGDFLEIYTEPDMWDCVATVFFIDTAHNILSYLETIWHILKPGGYWINMGPLLYHFSDLPGEDSLELSYEEVKLAIERLGFDVVKEKTGIRCGYTQNPSSMLAYEYQCVFGVFRKPVSRKEASPED